MEDLLNETLDYVVAIDGLTADPAIIAEFVSQFERLEEKYFSTGMSYTPAEKLLLLAAVFIKRLPGAAAQLVGRRNRRRESAIKEKIRELREEFNGFGCKWVL